MQSCQAFIVPETRGRSSKTFPFLLKPIGWEQSWTRERRGFSTHRKCPGLSIRTTKGKDDPDLRSYRSSGGFWEQHGPARVCSMDPGWLGILPSVPECTYPHCQHNLLDGGTGPNTTQYPHSRYLISESNVIKPRGKLWIYYSFIPTNDLSKCFSCFSSLPTGSPYVFRAGLVILPSLPGHSRHLCSSWGHSLRWTPESLFLNLWGRKLASRGINQVLTTCQPFHLQQGARLVTTQSSTEEPRKAPPAGRKQQPHGILASIMSACMRTSLCTRTFFPVLVL